MHVLKGAGHTIQSGMVKFIQFEFGHFHILLPAFFPDFWKLLPPHYNIYRIKVNCVVEIQQYSTELEVFRATKYICVLKALNFKL
jgi:hypothetical protein